MLGVKVIVNVGACVLAGRAVAVRPAGKLGRIVGDGVLVLVGACVLITTGVTVNVGACVNVSVASGLAVLAASPGTGVGVFGKVFPGDFLVTVTPCSIAAVIVTDPPACAVAKSPPASGVGVTIWL